MKETYLGIDIGTGSVKLLLRTFPAVNTAYAAWKEPYQSEGAAETSSPVGIQPAEQVEQAVLRGCRAVQQQAPELFKAIRGIGVSSHGPSLILADAAGKPLSPIITWQNHDAEKEAATLRSQFPDFTRDGTSWEAKLLYWKDRVEQLKNRSGTCLYPKDYVNLLLTGERGFDRSTASTIHFYSEERHSWEFSKIGMDDSLFPIPLNSWEIVGCTGTAFSRQCGFPDGIPAVAGGIDAYCEALGAGATNPGDITDGSGTSTCISVCLSDVPAGDYHVIPERRFLIEMMSSTGESVAWIQERLKENLETIRQLHFIKPVPVLFLPHLAGERSPYWDDRARGLLAGLNAETDDAELVGAVLQGTALGLLQNLRILEGKAGEVGISPGSVIYAAGGGAENRAWIQMKANITRKAYHLPSVSQTAPLGCAILAGMAVEGTDLLQSWKRELEQEELIEPDWDDSTAETVEILYRLYGELYNKTAEISHALSRLRQTDSSTVHKS